MIERLCQPEDSRDWDMAIVYMKGRPPLGLDTKTRIKLSEEDQVIEITNDECPDPLYNSQLDGPQPKICTLSITTKVEDIYGMDYIKYPKIIATHPNASKIITSNFGQA